MILHCKPVQRLCGRIQLPASKSYSIRAFIIAACGGTSQIKHASNCDDAKVAMKVSRTLGASISLKDRAWHVRASRWRQHKSRSLVFKVGESGTTLRFLLPLLSLYTQKARVEGKGTLMGRPCAHLCQTLRAQSMNIQGSGRFESIPIVYKGGMLSGGKISIDGSLSSQFISSLLIALPMLPKSSHVCITGRKMVSQDYILMTQQILAKSSVAIKRVSNRKYFIKGNQEFKGLKNFYVPSDYGLAAFLMAAASLIASDVFLEGNLNDDWAQSDGHILQFLRRMGVIFKKTKKTIHIKGPFHLKGGTFVLKNCPDLVPIMSILGLFAKTPTRLVDIHHARAKESDRISDLREELLKIGAHITEKKGSLTIYPRNTYKKGQLLDAHHDHRLAMSFAVLGLKLGCRISGMESCRKSYPDFLRDIKSLI